MNDDEIETCPQCGEPYCEDFECMESGDDRDSPEDEWPPCGCPYCYCSVPTEYGEKCSDCAMGAHQG